jgi:hypothetical protein
MICLSKLSTLIIIFLLIGALIRKICFSILATTLRKALNFEQKFKYFLIFIIFPEFIALELYLDKKETK